MARDNWVRRNEILKLVERIKQNFIKKKRREEGKEKKNKICAAELNEKKISFTNTVARLRAQQKKR